MLCAIYNDGAQHEPHPSIDVTKEVASFLHEIRPLKRDNPIIVYWSGYIS